jgi:hypothetical protein
LNSAPLPLSFIPFAPHSWNSFNRYLFSIDIHVYTVFALYSSSYTLSLPLPHSHWNQPLQAGPVLLFCSLILQKKERRNDSFACLKIAAQGVSCGSSEYIHAIARIGSSPLFPSTFLPFLWLFQPI